MRPSGLGRERVLPGTAERSRESRVVATAPAKGGYVPEIDGLRTVAVLSVLFYHAGFATLGGGFVGVDVFFVISGFLITRLIRDEIVATGRFDFFRFYVRRARRLLPAMAATVAASFVFARCLFSSEEMLRFAASAGAALLSVSNASSGGNRGISTRSRRPSRCCTPGRSPSRSSSTCSGRPCCSCCC